MLGMEQRQKSTENITRTNDCYYHHNDFFSLSMNEKIIKRSQGRAKMKNSSVFLCHLSYSAIYDPALTKYNLMAAMRQHPIIRNR